MESAGEGYVRLEGRVGCITLNRPQALNALNRSIASLKDGDFLEGIRAAVIDKDQKPRWRHAGIQLVPPELVERMLSEADGGDPNFNIGGA